MSGDRGDGQIYIGRWSNIYWEMVKYMSGDGQIYISGDGQMYNGRWSSIYKEMVK